MGKSRPGEIWRKEKDVSGGKARGWREAEHRRSGSDELREMGKWRNGVSYPMASKSCSAFQTYPKSKGESLEDFNMRVMKSDTIYWHLPCMYCGREIGGGRDWK